MSVYRWQDDDGEHLIVVKELPRITGNVYIERQWETCMSEDGKYAFFPKAVAVVTSGGTVVRIFDVNKCLTDPWRVWDGAMRAAYKSVQGMPCQIVGVE